MVSSSLTLLGPALTAASIIDHKRSGVSATSLRPAAERLACVKNQLGDER